MIKSNLSLKIHKVSGSVLSPPLTTLDDDHDEKNNNTKSFFRAHDFFRFHSLSSSREYKFKRETQNSLVLV